MNPKDELGRTGEQVAAEYLERAGLRILDRNWRSAAGEVDIVACRAAGTGRLRGEDPLGHQVRHAAGGVTRNKRARLRRLAAQWLVAHGVLFDEVRIDVIGLVKDKSGSSRSSTSGGWARCRSPAPTRSPWSGSKAIRSRSRPTSRTGCRACCWSVYRTLPCARHATGSAQRSSTATSSGRSAGSRWACPRPACPSEAAVSTSASPCRFWPRPVPFHRPRSTAWSSSGSLGWTAGCARFAESFPRWQRPGAPGLARRSWPSPMPRRRRWCRGSGLPGRRRWAACSPGCAVSRRRRTLAWFACRTGASRAAMPGGAPPARGAKAGVTVPQAWMVPPGPGRRRRPR